MRIARILTLGALAGAAAFAQTSGTMNITGSIGSQISITSAAETALSTTAVLGALLATNTSALTSITPVVVHIRSNQKYSLSAISAFTITGGGVDDGGSPMTPADIGFGITAKDATGTKMATTHTDTIVPKFDYTVGGLALTVTDGLTPFTAAGKGTLNDIIASTPIVSGTRVSKLGNINTLENFLSLSFGAATLPQYFTPNTSFQALVTLTIVTN